MGRWAVEEWVEARSREERNSANEVDEGKGKGKGKGKDKMILDDQLKEEERGTMEERVEGEGLDEWSRVWQVSKKEIRDTFLSVNAVRWTQPIHLSGT
jgi:cleavage and polyadenylation specificity factor subunit 2